MGQSRHPGGRQALPRQTATSSTTNRHCNGRRESELHVPAQPWLVTRIYLNSKVASPEMAFMSSYVVGQTIFWWRSHPWSLELDRSSGTEQSWRQQSGRSRWCIEAAWRGFRGDNVATTIARYRQRTHAEPRSLPESIALGSARFCSGRRGQVLSARLLPSR